MNKNKVIKDLKERNDKLFDQYRNRDFRCITLELRIERAIKYIKNIKPLSLEETALKESIKQAYNESSHIKNCKESFDMVCHLEDFEIAVWNILNILEGK